MNLNSKLTTSELRSLNSSQLFERSKKVAPGGVHSPVRAFKNVGGQPLFFKSTSGPFMTSVEGDTYIDFCQSFGPNLLGHRDPDVMEVVREALDEAWTFGACEPYSLELAEWITQRLPWVEKIRFVCSGTEAVMSALRVARAATQRSKILKFEGCYHGHVDSLLVKAGSGLAEAATSDSAGVSQAIAAETLVSPLNDSSTLEKIMATRGHEIAAIVLEPLPANYGLLQQDKSFIEAIHNVAKKYNSLVIYDEVISGFRVALGGMVERLGLSAEMHPDLVTYGKVIGGGFPVGAYAGRADLLDLVAPQGPVYQAGTLAANPIGVRAGLATLKKAIDKNVYFEINKRTEKMAHSLNSFFQQKNYPLAVAHEASLFWLHIKNPKGVKTPEDFHPDSKDVYKKIFHACLKRNIYLAPSAFEVGFVSYAHTEALLEEAVHLIQDAIDEVYA